MSVDVPLDNIKIKEIDTIDFGTGVNLDLANIGITKLEPINIALTQLPEIILNACVKVTELPTINVISDSKVDLGLDNIKVDLGLDNVKVDLGLDNIRIRELPQLDFQFGLRPMRFHFPLNYKVCLSLFGCKVFQFESCGESMFIAEDYKPRKSEECK